MSDFGSILRRGRRMFDMKNRGGDWGRCEECDDRKIIFPYEDEENQIWMLCEQCMETFIKDE